MGMALVGLVIINRKVLRHGTLRSVSIYFNTCKSEGKVISSYTGLIPSLGTKVSNNNMSKPEAPLMRVIGIVLYASVLAV